MEGVQGSSHPGTSHAGPHTAVVATNSVASRALHRLHVGGYSARSDILEEEAPHKPMSVFQDGRENHWDIRDIRDLNSDHSNQCLTRAPLLIAETRVGYPRGPSPRTSTRGPVGSAATVTPINTSARAFRAGNPGGPSPRTSTRGSAGLNATVTPINPNSGGFSSS